MDSPGTLMTKTLELLKQRDLLEVYDETGIPFYWLRKFRYGEYQNPGVNRVQRLYEYLSASKLL